jgi:site-specific DNA-methyltransferase (adenine-specific)
VTRQIELNRFEIKQDGSVHPTQKPVKLYDWIFHNYAKPNDTIFDSHLGSGSSRIAADKHNLPFLGTETDADYFRDHVKRFNRYTAQLTLF